MKKYYMICISLLISLSTYADALELEYNFEFEGYVKTSQARLSVSLDGATLDESLNLPKDHFDKTSYIDYYSWSKEAEKSVEFVDDKGNIVSSKKAQRHNLKGVEKCIMVKSSKVSSVILMNKIQKNWHFFCPSRIIIKTYGFDNTNIMPSENISKIKTFHMNSEVPMKIDEYDALGVALYSAEKDGISIDPGCWSGVSDDCPDEFLRDETPEYREEYNKRYNTKIVPDETSGFTWNRQ